MHPIFYFQLFTAFDFGTREIKAEEVEALGLSFCTTREDYFVNCKSLRGYCGDYGYPIPTPYVYPTGYGVPYIDRISLKGLRLNPNLYVKEISGILVGYDCILSVTTYSVRDMGYTL